MLQPEVDESGKRIEGGDASMNADNDDLVEHEAKDYTNVGPPGFYEDDI